MKDKIFLSVVFILFVGMAYFLTKIFGGTDDDFYCALLVMVLCKAVSLILETSDKLKSYLIEKFLK